MKKVILLFSIAIIFCNISFAQTPDWIWAKSAVSTNEAEANSVAVDALGNSYIAGDFYSDTIIFGSIILTNAGYDNIFLAKYDVNGNVLWAKSAGGTDIDVARSVTIDVSGNIYIAGEFGSDTITFASTTLTKSNNGSNVFLAKYDTNGNVLWAKKTDETNYYNGWDFATANSVKTDISGNIYLAGFFYSPDITFDSITLINADTSTYSSNHNCDIYLAKYDVNGNVLWVKRAGGFEGDVAYSLVVDALGNTYLAGGFQSTNIVFGDTTFACDGNNDIFLAKYDVNGNVLWAKRAGGTDWENATCVAADASGNAYLAGEFMSSTITFDTIALTNAYAGYNDIFIAKYDANGNVIWAKSAGGSSADYATSIAVDALGNNYVVGSFASPTLSFDTITLTNAYVFNSDIFLTKYDASGNILWAKSVGGTGNDYPKSIALDPSKNIYTAGKFNSSNLAFGSTTLTRVGYGDIFLAKLASDTHAGIDDMSNSLNIFVFPNPATEGLTIEVQQKAIIEILNINGQIIKIISSHNNTTKVDLTDLSSGVYIVRVKTDKEIVTKKFIKQ